MYAGSNGKAAFAAEDAWPSEFAATAASVAGSDDAGDDDVIGMPGALGIGAPPTAGVSM